MIRLIQRRLIIPRGDTGTFTVPLLATAQTGDVSVFTIFDQRTQKKVFEKIVTIEGEALQIEFSHADTVNLPVGDYVWDIKFYKDPIIVDDKLIDGTEIDSYYAAFKLPVCEIRQTGDTLLTADDAPTTTIEPNTLNVLTAAMEVTSQNKASVEQAAATVAEDLEEVEGLAAQVRENAEVAGDAATNASESASAAGEALADTISAKNDAIAANTAAQQALTNVNAAATNATIKATEANASAAAASNSASAASTSASEAATSASNAAASVTEMEALVRAIPTNISEFENDAGYITAAALPTKVSDLTDDSGHYTKPAGGIPASDLAETYLTEHQDISGKADKSEIPTKVSQLQNDSGYLTSFTETDPTVPAWAKAAQKPSYTAAEVGAPTVSEMNSAISEAIGQVNSFDMAVVQELPTTNISTHTIYLVPKTGETNDVYDEYIYINNAWEMVGNTQIDLSNYVQKTDYATGDNAGVVKVNDDGTYGIRMLNGQLAIKPPANTAIKNGTSGNQPLTPLNQHESTFYGLAKAAGDSTQSQSNNAVGTYTDEAKTAIQQMLDVPAKADIPEVPVQDVQVNGTSILENGVANVPVANDTLGLVRVASTGQDGVRIRTEDGTRDKLMIVGATETEIKNRNNFKPVLPSHQHESTFYGLAKAAGADMAQSSNAVGTYTDAAKTAIKNMIGVEEGLKVVRLI